MGDTLRQFDLTTLAPQAVLIDVSTVVTGATSSGSSPTADQSSEIGAVLAEQNDEWADGRRYLGLDVLSRSRLALITSTTNENQEATMTTAAISA